MIEIALIGSTGSVGTQALEVVREHPEEFRIVALTAHKNLPLLLKQIQEFHPKAVGISDDKTYNSAKEYIDKDLSLIHIFPTTLWQGMIKETGLWPTAPPTACADIWLPVCTVILAAMSP